MEGRTSFTDVMQTWAGDEILRHLPPLDILRFKGQPVLHNAALRFASRYGTKELLTMALRPPRKSRRWPALAIACLSSGLVRFEVASSGPVTIRPITEVADEITVLLERSTVMWWMKAKSLSGNAAYMRAVLQTGRIRFERALALLCGTNNRSPEMVQAVIQHPPFRHPLLSEVSTRRVEYSMLQVMAAFEPPKAASKRTSPLEEKYSREQSAEQLAADSQPCFRCIDRVACIIVHNSRDELGNDPGAKSTIASLRHCLALLASGSSGSSGSSGFTRWAWYVMACLSANKQVEDFIWSIRDLCLGPPSLVSGSSGSSGSGSSGSGSSRLRYIHCLDARVDLPQLITRLVEQESRVTIGKVLADPGTSGYMPSVRVGKMAVARGNIEVVRAIYEAVRRASGGEGHRRKVNRRWMDGTMVEHAIYLSSPHRVIRHERSKLAMECIHQALSLALAIEATEGRSRQRRKRRISLGKVLLNLATNDIHPDAMHAVLTALTPFERGEWRQLSQLLTCRHTSIIRRLIAAGTVEPPKAASKRASSLDGEAGVIADSMTHYPNQPYLRLIDACPYMQTGQLVRLWQFYTQRDPFFAGIYSGSGSGSSGSSSGGSSSSGSGVNVDAVISVSLEWLRDHGDPATITLFACAEHSEILRVEQMLKQCIYLARDAFSIRAIFDLRDAALALALPEEMLAEGDEAMVAAKKSIVIIAQGLMLKAIAYERYYVFKHMLRFYVEDREMRWIERLCGREADASCSEDDVSCSEPRSATRWPGDYLRNLFYVIMDDLICNCRVRWLTYFFDQMDHHFSVSDRGAIATRKIDHMEALRHDASAIVRIETTDRRYQLCIAMLHDYKERCCRSEQAQASE